MIWLSDICAFRWTQEPLCLFWLTCYSDIRAVYWNWCSLFANFLQEREKAFKTFLLVDADLSFPSPFSPLSAKPPQWGGMWGLLNLTPAAWQAARRNPVLAGHIEFNWEHTSLSSLLKFWQTPVLRRAKRNNFCQLLFWHCVQHSTTHCTLLGT